MFRPFPSLLPFAGFFTPPPAPSAPRTGDRYQLRRAGPASMNGRRERERRMRQAARIAARREG